MAGQKTLFFIISLGIALPFARGDSVCCKGTVNECFSDDPPFDHLPVPYCEDGINPNARLFTRGGDPDGIPITSRDVPPTFSSRKRTIFVAHGFLNEQGMEWMENLRKSLLKKEDANVIQVGWGDGSITINYFQAASNIRVVGAFVAKITSNLIANHGVRRESTWCIGHSLGSHLCGHAGIRLKFGRITGMDPAGPLFENYDIRAGLHPPCADYVDAIHTMGGNGIIMDFGTLKPLGHADYYPNGGKVQPGCINYAYGKELSPTVDLYPICSHMRAVDYMQESLDGSCVFWARRKCSDEKNLPGSCVTCGNRCAIMGYAADQLKTAGKFYLQTNDDTPFCRG